MELLEKLLIVQMNLKAPKGQYNDFGKYRYRSCEDILEAAKPLLDENGLLLTLSDEIEEKGSCIYVKATATIVDITEPNHKFSVSASARDEGQKKGMDGSQVTGAASSYARKYALNGLFLIDDTKDSDATNTGDGARAQGKQPPQNQNRQQPPTCSCCGKVIQGVKKNGKKYFPADIAKISIDRYKKVACWNCMTKLKEANVNA